MTYETATRKAQDSANKTGKPFFVKEEEFGYKAVKITKNNQMDVIFSEAIFTPERVESFEIDGKQYTGTPQSVELMREYRASGNQEMVGVVFHLGVMGGAIKEAVNG